MAVMRRAGAGAARGLRARSGAVGGLRRRVEVVADRGRDVRGVIEPRQRGWPSELYVNQLATIARHTFITPDQEDNNQSRATAADGQLPPA